MNTNAAAALAQVTPATIRRWIYNGHIIATKVNGKWAISETSLRIHLGLQAEVETAAPADTETEIRTAYLELAGTPGTWVDLADLRSRIARPAEEVTATLAAMMLRFNGTHLVPEADQKTLTPARREAAVHIHGIAKHLVAIEG